MLEKLLSFFLHAKSGTVATVLVLGASGALVTATVDNGMTTITITQPAEDQDGTTAPDGSTTTTLTVNEAILALFTRTSAEDDPTSTATGEGCSDEAHARNEQMKRVNDHAQVSRAAISELARDASDVKEARDLAKDFDKEIKDLRRDAVKAIHATFDCDNDEDEDEDEDEDSDDEDSDDEDEDSDDEDEDSDDEDATDPVFTGDDAKAIADLAIELMDDVVADFELALEGLEDSDEATTTNAKQNGKSEKDKHDNKGKGNGKDNSRHGGGNDDDEDDD